MRHAVHTCESGTSFEVDEYEIQLVRGMAQRQRQYQGSQHFGFTRTGGADEHAMRAHAMLAHLFDVKERGTGVVE